MRELKQGIILGTLFVIFVILASVAYGVVTYPNWGKSNRFTRLEVPQESVARSQSVPPTPTPIPPKLQCDNCNPVVSAPSFTGITCTPGDKLSVYRDASGGLRVNPNSESIDPHALVGLTRWLGNKQWRFVSVDDQTAVVHIALVQNLCGAR